jgi:RHS repeat-associated protein
MLPPTPATMRPPAGTKRPKSALLKTEINVDLCLPREGAKAMSEILRAGDCASNIRANGYNRDHPFLKIVINFTSERNRMYSPTLGRWMQMDPAGYVDGLNAYQEERSSPVATLDPAGTQAEAQPTIDSIKVEVDPEEPASDNAWGYAFHAKITVKGTCLDKFEIRQLIKSSTTRKDWDGKPMTIDQIKKELDADPVVISTDGKFETDTGWDWQELTDIAQAKKTEKDDGQVYNVDNRPVELADRIAKEVKLSSTTREFRIEIRERATKMVVKTFDWGYTWDNFAALWKDGAPKGDVVARASIAPGAFSNVTGITGLPWEGAGGPATRPATGPATRPATGP